MLMLKKIRKTLKSKQVTTTFKIGNFIWARHTNPFKRILAGVLLTISKSRYSKNAMSFLEHEKTKDDSF